VAVVTPLLGWLLWSSLPASRPWLRQVAAAGIVLAILPPVLHWPADIRRHGASWPVLPSGEDWSKSARLLGWLRDHTPPDSVIAGNLDPMYFLYAGRKAVRAFETDAFLLYYGTQPGGRPIGTGETFARRLRALGVDFLVMTPNLGFGEAPHFRLVVEELERACGGCLTVATGDPSRGYAVYRIDRAKL
jgi:hypothetical protein